MGELLTIEQTMQLLHRKRSTIYAYMDRGDDPLPYIQVEGGRLVDRDDLNRWLDRRRRGRQIAPLVQLPARRA